MGRFEKTKPICRRANERNLFHNNGLWRFCRFRDAVITRSFEVIKLPFSGTITLRRFYYLLYAGKKGKEWQTGLARTQKP
jgi:hypothetical protein